MVYGFLLCVILNNFKVNVYLSFLVLRKKEKEEEKIEIDGE